MSAQPIYDRVTKKTDEPTDVSPKTTEEPQYCPMSPVIIPKNTMDYSYRIDS